MTSTEEALKEALEPPRDYYGSITDLVAQGWAQVSGRHRDSSVLDISNWETMLTFYHEKYELNEDFRVESSSHWAVGWCDVLLVRALDCMCVDWEDADFIYQTIALDNETTGKWWVCQTCGEEADVRPVFDDAMDFAERLQDYPVLDEFDYSRREYEEMIEWIEDELPYAWRRIDEDADMPEISPADVFSYLFDTYSISNVDDISDYDQLVDAVRHVSGKS